MNNLSLYDCSEWSKWCFHPCSHCEIFSLMTLHTITYCVSRTMYKKIILFTRNRGATLRICWDVRAHVWMGKVMQICKRLRRRKKIKNYSSLHRVGVSK